MIEQFLIPSLITAILCIIAASIKAHEYYIMHDFGPLSIIAVFCRFGIGLVYIFTTSGFVSERTILIRFFISLLMLAEILRHALKQIRIRRARKVATGRI